MENVLSWLQLSFLFGGTTAGGKLLQKYRTADAILSLEPNLLLNAGEISKTTADKLRLVHELRASAQTVAAVCRNFGWQVLTPQSKYYPQEFLYIKDPPYVLYACGDLTCLTQRQKAAVVGTRKPADKAAVAAYDLAAVLSQNGIVTVSGGALGIDSAAHEGALTAAGGTVCILGMGLGHQYLPEKAFMRRRIAKHGVLLSETTPFEGPTLSTFPRRNRLIAAMASSLTVIQSDVRGGSMISADYARQYGRQLFALSPSVYASPGCEKLIAEGAEALESTGQLTSLYGAVFTDDWPLKNTGNLPPVLTPTRCTLSEFARLNGVTEAEAFPLYEELCGRDTAAKPFEVHNALTKKRPPAAQSEPAPEPAPAQDTYAQRIKIADEKHLSGDERTVYLALPEGPCYLDELGERTGLSPGALSTALTYLELMGLAETLPGNMAGLTDPR